MNLHSNMDRLKPNRNSTIYGYCIHLHSNMDRLKPVVIATWEAACSDLHSNMDRLKLSAVRCAVSKMQEFTFQYG